ncbi:MAG: prolipoprotein diacylglyceryl transferase [Clostridia bacterium]|nr:prolipoprotein diacylglyceryl transferase [Clostridia bacterium]
MDTVLVRFAGIAKEFSVSKTLASFSFFGNTVNIRWYGAIIAFGFLLAALLGGRIAYKWKISLDKMVDVLIYGTFGGVIGARLFYVFSRWDYYGSHPGDIVKIWEGGLAIYGGIIGGLICAFIVCKIEKINVLNLLDMVGISLLVGQGIGRWGNFANQEAFGTFTGKHFGMMSDTVIEYIKANPADFGLSELVKNGGDVSKYIADNDLYVHPTFFYESVWCLLGVAVLYIVLRKFRLFSGQMFLTYGVWYGMERAVVEGMRTDSLYISGTSLRISQVISMLLVAVCGVLLVGFIIKFKKNPKPVEGVDFFPEKTAKELEEYEKKQMRKAIKQERKKVKIAGGKIVSDQRKQKEEENNVSDNN